MPGLQQPARRNDDRWYAGRKVWRRQVPFPKTDFGPRFGLAYNPTPKVVLRAGAGIVFQASAFQAAGTTGSPGNEGFATQTNFNPSFTNQDNLPVATLYSPDPVILAANPGAGTPFSVLRSSARPSGFVPGFCGVRCGY